VPDGLDPCDIPADVLDVFNLGRRSVSFGDYRPQASTSIERDWREGSNNWVVAPERTSTGRPILANDPHRAHNVPSLRYISHLVAPGMNVIGAGEPALPGISIGHNDRIAFGLTIFAIDQADLYVYELNEKGEYRYGNGWESFATLVETVAVRDAEDLDVSMSFTRHGPVVYRDDKRAFAIRLGFLEPGMAPYFGSV
jgi:penicillin amidase